MPLDTTNNFYDIKPPKKDPFLEKDVTNISLYLREGVYGFTPSEIDQKKISKRLLERLSISNVEKKSPRHGIILGAKLSKQLEVDVGDSIKLISSELVSVTAFTS